MNILNCPYTAQFCDLDNETAGLATHIPTQESNQNGLFLKSYLVRVDDHFLKNFTKDSRVSCAVKKYSCNLCLPTRVYLDSLGIVRYIVMQIESQTDIAIDMCMDLLQSLIPSFGKRLEHSMHLANQLADFSPSDLKISTKKWFGMRQHRYQPRPQTQEKSNDCVSHMANNAAAIVANPRSISSSNCIERGGRKDEQTGLESDSCSSDKKFNDIIDSLTETITKLFLQIRYSTHSHNLNDGVIALNKQLLKSVAFSMQNQKKQRHDGGGCNVGVVLNDNDKDGANHVNGRNIHSTSFKTPLLAAAAAAAASAVSAAITTATATTTTTTTTMTTNSNGVRKFKKLRSLSKVSRYSISESVSENSLEQTRQRKYHRRRTSMSMSNRMQLHQRNHVDKEVEVLPGNDIKRRNARSSSKYRVVRKCGCANDCEKERIEEVQVKLSPFNKSANST